MGNLLASRSSLLANAVLKVCDQIRLHEYPRPTDLRAGQFTVAGEIKRRGAVDLEKIGRFVDVVGPHYLEPNCLSKISNSHKSLAAACQIATAISLRQQM